MIKERKLTQIRQYFEIKNIYPNCLGLFLIDANLDLVLQLVQI